jgi:hypothetical protein
MIENLPIKIRIGVINVSVAGCKIELFDKVNYSAYISTITETWLKNIIAEYDGNPYSRLVEMAKLAQKDGVIKGILLHQGESNTGDTQWPAKVKTIYNNLIADLGLDPAKVPLLAGELVNADQGGVCASMNNIISKLPQTLSNSFVISSSKCTDGTDNVHFNSAGYRELGKRYANKVLSLMGIVPTGFHPTRFTETDNEKIKVFPNPVHGMSSVSFEISGKSFVTIKIYNISGSEVKKLAGKVYSAGPHSLEFDSKSIGKGVYILTFSAEDKYLMRKIAVQ